MILLGAGGRALSDEHARESARVVNAVQPRFVSTLVAVRSADDPEALVAVGRWHGQVLDAPRGTGGFGYDPLFFLPELGKTVAELDAPSKNAHSHRALAAREMLRLLGEAWDLAPAAGRAAAR